MASTYISLPAISISGPVDVVVDAAQDSIKISDGTNTLQVNGDGSINVSASLTGGPALENHYAEVTNVAASIPTTVASYVAVAGAKLRRVEASGTNIAEFEVQVNGFTEGKKYTYFSGPLSVSFDFPEGLQLTVADVVSVRVTHSRPDVGNFNANIMVWN